MPSAASQLPIVEQTLDLEYWRDQVAERDAKIEAQQKEITALRREVAMFRRELKRLLAARKRGHLIDEGQLTLFGEDSAEEQDGEATPEHALEAADGEEADDPVKKRHKPKRPSRKVDISNLPRKTVIHELAEEQRICPVTGLELVPVGEKVFEEIEYIAAQLYVIEHHRIEYGLAPDLAKDRQVKPLIAPMPPRPVEGCTAGPHLLAQVLVQKYAHHLPLYRQEEVFQQAGLLIPRQTLCDWVLAATFELRPIAYEVMRQIRAGPILQLDDTPVKCRGPKGSGYFQAYLWTFANPEVPGIAFSFTNGRAAKKIEPLIEGFEGYLVGDGYAGHFAAARNVGGNITHGGCWAHVLRKFRDAIKEAGGMAKQYMSDIRGLYDIESEADAAEMDALDRLELRRRKGRPLIARMLWRARGWKEMFSVSGNMGDALKYLLNQRKPLQCFLLNGGVPIDNNACERSIRPVAVGRRNWLFAGSERGGEAAAVAYTLIGSCRLAGINPSEYLSDVLVRMPTHSANEIADLVPARWAQLRATAEEA